MALADHLPILFPSYAGIWRNRYYRIGKGWCCGRASDLLFEMRRGSVKFLGAARDEMAKRCGMVEPKFMVERQMGDKALTVFIANKIGTWCAGAAYQAAQ